MPPFLPKKSYPNELWTHPDNGVEKAVNRVVVGPVEEEEQRIGVASDVVQVEGEDPATGTQGDGQRATSSWVGSRWWLAIHFVGTAPKQMCNAPCRLDSYLRLSLTLACTEALLQNSS